MISVTEARQIIREHTSPLPPVQWPLSKAAGLVLAEDVFAALDMPSFRQSSMDGYALSFRDWKEHGRLKIAGVIAAGNKDDIPLAPGTAVRIFTGAAVPSGADTVVMQEKVRVENGELLIDDLSLEREANVRPIGVEIRSGDLALGKGSFLNPAAIGFLTGLGTREVFVYPKPVVSIVVTGNELQDAGSPLEYGQVYESNSYGLKAALQEWHINEVTVFRVADTLDELTAVLAQALEQSDVVLLTGGISVGDFDFVLQATINNGVHQHFHRIKQRPAKPLFFGKWENKYVFGLPGNPASGLTAFYEYALPALGIMSRRNYTLQTLNVPLSKAFKKPAGLTHFLKGHYDGHTATPLNAQESFRLSSFAHSNCLIQINEEVTDCPEGSLVEVHLLPG